MVWTNRLTAVACGLCAAVPFVSADGFDFDARPAVTIGYRPAAVELVDVSADQVLDLIVVNTGEFNDVWNGSNVQVFLGKGDGTFGPPATYVTPDAPHGLAVGDLDGDLVPDLVTANAAPDTLSILINQGDGKFVAGAVIAVQADPIDIVAVDLNGDQVCDLASADQFGFGVSVALNDGHGNFAAPTFLYVGELVNGLVAGDIDEDLDADLIAFLSSGPVWLENDGSGGFSMMHSLALGPVDGRATLGLINPDSQLDLVVGSQVWFGRGDGSFDTPSAATGLADDWVRVCDFDDDGDNDVVTGAGVALNTGAGFFAGTVDFDPPPDSGPIAVGRFVGDDLLDLARAQGGIAGPIGFVTLLEGLGGGAVPVFGRVPGGDSVWAMTVARIDDDPHLDVLVANIGTPFGQFLNGSVSVLTGDGAGTLNPLTSFAAGDYVRTIAAGDLNGDERVDAVVTAFNANTASVLRNDGAGGLLPRVAYAAGDKPEALAIDNFDLLHGLDMAVANYRLGTLPGQVNVVLADVHGGFLNPTPHTLMCDRAGGIVAALLDSDNAPDLATICAGRYFGGQWLNFGVEVLMNDGAGGFDPPVRYDTQYTPRTIHAVDVDDDQDVDLIVTTHGPTTKILFVGEVLAFLNDGSGHFAAPLSTPLTNDHFSSACGDLDGDRIPDLLVPYLSSSVVTLLPGKGDGTFGAPAHFATGAEPRAVAIGDFNGDEASDIAVAHSEINEVGLMLALGGKVGDLNCDGRIDFGDINPFVLALTNPAGYAVQFPNCDIRLGDINADGRVDFGDINPFVDLLTSA